jgi:hypothetical protein
MEESIERLGRKSDAANRRHTRGLRGVNRVVRELIGGFTRLGIGISGAAVATMTLRKEYDRYLQLQEQAAQTTLDVAAAERKAATVLPAGVGVENLRQQFIEAGVAGVQGGIAGLLLATEAAISAAGKDLPAETAIQAVIEAAKVAPLRTTEERRELVSGALELIKGFPQLRGPGGAEAAVASVFNIFAAARTEELGAVSKNIAVGTAQLAGLGEGRDQFQDLAGMLSAVSQLAGDPTGRRTRTNVLNFMNQIMPLAKEQGVVPLEAGVMETLRTVQGGRTEGAARLRRGLLGVFDPSFRGQEYAEISGRLKLEEEFKETMRTEAQTRTAFIAMLQGSKVWTEQFEAAKNAIAPLETAAAELAERFKELEGLATQITARAQMALRGATEEARLVDEGGALRAATREGLREILQRAGYSATAADLDVFMGNIESAGRTPREQLESVRDVLLRRAQRGTRPQYFPTFGGTAIGVPELSSEETQLLLRAIQHLNHLLEQMEQRDRQPQRIIVEGPDGIKKPARAEVGAL